MRNPEVQSSWTVSYRSSSRQQKVSIRALTLTHPVQLVPGGNHAGNTPWPPQIHLYWWQAHMQPVIYLWHQSDWWQQWLTWSPFQQIRARAYWMDILAEIHIWSASAMAAMARLNRNWWSNTISLASKFMFYKSLVTSILLYGCETWTLLADSEKRTQAFETWGNFSTSPTWSTRPTTLCGARSTSLLVHRSLFWQLSRDQH